MMHARSDIELHVYSVIEGTCIHPRNFLELRYLENKDDGQRLKWHARGGDCVFRRRHREAETHGWTISIVAAND